MATKKRTRGLRGPGIDESTADPKLVGINRSISSGSCGSAFIGILDYAGPQRRDYGEVLHFFGERCLVKKRRR